ncbi:hypothetical protein HOY82DRAFT_113865 [Tuber indicum]|nr:hypothetical protein HOY82DRAFT_113865 [Tuber indicum]
MCRTSEAGAFSEMALFTRYLYALEGTSLLAMPRFWAFSLLSCMLKMPCSMLNGILHNTIIYSTVLYIIVQLDELLGAADNLLVDYTTQRGSNEKCNLALARGAPWPTWLSVGALRRQKSGGMHETSRQVGSLRVRVRQDIV